MPTTAASTPTLSGSGKERENGFAPAAPIDCFPRPRADGIHRDQWPPRILTFYCDRLNHQA